MRAGSECDRRLDQLRVRVLETKRDWISTDITLCRGHGNSPADPVEVVDPQARLCSPPSPRGQSDTWAEDRDDGVRYQVEPTLTRAVRLHTDLRVGNTCDFAGVDALVDATSLASEMKVAQTWIAIGPSSRDK